MLAYRLLHSALVNNPMTNAGLSVSISESVALFALDRPSHRNAVNVPMVSSIIAALEQYDCDGVRAIVLVGNGDHFCVGADLDHGAEVFDAAKQGRPHS